MDVYNVPADKDVILDRFEKELVAIGRKLEKDQHSEGSKNVNSMIFEEKNFEEFKKDQFFAFERFDIFFDWKDFFRASFFRIVYIVPIFFLLDTWTEYYRCKTSVMQIDEQEIESYENIKREYKRNELLNNSIYNVIN